ncbi:ATP-dependent Clp protease ATP-binding subunit, partial [Patescibacteria group bacterium]|nr:ATP-dependent Clp protease ATP-binding subunit [Patescibacteria group bacterium]
MPKSSHSITDKFSTRLKKAFVTAAKMAESENMTALRTDHLVQALYFQEGSIAAEVLRKSNIKPTVFRKNMPAIGDSALPTIMPGKDALNPKTKDISNLGKLFNLVQKNDIKKTQDLHLSQGLEKALMKAALLAKKFNHSFIGTEHMLLAILENPKNKICQLLAQNKVNVKDIKEQVKNILASTAKFTDMTIMFSPEHKKGAKRTETIKTYCEDLTTKKKSKTIDPLIGRDKEIERMINVLGRRNKNNVLLIGEPGVGKTAIVEGLAKRMSAGDIPPLLREKKILQLDLAKMIAGTMFRGEFEGRLKSLIEEAEKDPNAIIFVDELHSIIGLGNAQGSMDATNIIKPALTSGNFQCIGITTFDEYRKHIENDPAFERRFQKIKIEEPEVEEAIKIISGVKEFYENYHGVKIEPDAIKETVKLSHRYLPEKCLPDKALDLLDEASSKVNIKLSDSKLFDKIETKRKELIKTSKQKSKAVVKEKFEEALSLQAREQTLKKEIATLKSKEKRDRKEWPTITSEDIAQVIS